MLDAAAALRGLYRDYVYLGRYAHFSLAEARQLTDTARRALLEATMDVIEEENEAQRAAMRDKDD